MTFKQPRLAFYHRQDDGSGACLLMELYPAQGTQCGYIRTIIAPQVDASVESGFDWLKRAQINLGTNDLIAMLAVLTGIEDTLPNGKIVNKSSGKTYSITFAAIDGGGYEMGISHESGRFLVVRGFTLTEAEGNGIRAIIEGCLPKVAFGN